ncbi:MAG TPA: 1-(5-phosphoribosyl)-5-[(5-phosphoribosylamino)methylideneamino]imidazole-4-carboxamide isomerase [Solirubrobacterales bacterium]|nr:1-(5-phosphoribosyl)-5-[(5-phosphoribosylamino)methylideneamino]imidazole-4-carboxamide isomerase [Solirubrobacterales bacterium]
MILYPAIDIRDGHAVRLMQGDYERETAYDADPLDAAQRWVDQGAGWLHVVDLDGARSGVSKNLEHVRRIANETDAKVQMGGGLRDGFAVERALSAGAERVVLGTAALADPEFLEEMLDEHGQRVVVGVDARGGVAATQGWTETSGEAAPALIRDLAERGVSRIVWTPIEVDGTMEGPPIGQLTDVADELDAELIYSGGVGSLSDLETLAGTQLPALGGVIVGRALYEERFDVAEALRALDR